jgi:hypothetical protein
LDYCSFFDIYENIFEENDGDQYTNCDTLEFSNNTWTINNYGLYLGNCMSCKVMDNFFLENIHHAVTLYSTTSTTLYQNWFVNNNLLGDINGDNQARDEGGTNIWYYGTSGNFWSDYDGSGLYLIDSGSAVDPYPIYDTDDDELDDYTEIYIIGTDFNDSDHDDDGLPDGYEVANLLDPFIDDSADDPDSDDFSNIDEYKHGCDPQDEDTDDDLIYDGYEVYNSLNPLFDDSDLDFDGDGLSNLEEFNLGTKANNYDSDQDGMSDSWENEKGLNPLLNDAWDDPDNDSLNNFLEYIYNCDPFNNDTDGDSHTDGWEILHGTNPNDVSDYPDISQGSITDETSFKFVYLLFSIVGLAILFNFKSKK